ncbi:MAG: DUF6600 domain-containing protein [bacterium]|jgi:hypothetical protein
MLSAFRNILHNRISLTFGLVFMTLIGTVVPSSFAAGEEVQLRVARLAFLEGDVSVQRVGDESWVDGMINMPLMAGDQIYSGKNGRLELQLDDGAILHLGEETYVYISFLDDGLQQFEVYQGTVVVTNQDAKYDTPPLEIKSSYFRSTVTNGTVVRFDVERSGPATAKVFDGILRVFRNEESHFKVFAGDMLVVRHSDPDTYTVVSSSPEDPFDTWSRSRTRLILSSTSRSYVTDRLVGHYDLDTYGDWIEVEEYGRVWRPRVSITVSNWAPYREGRWAWRDYYGWTWVSYEPWGWMPYHYGRWAYHPRHRWYWIPTDVVISAHYHRDYYYHRHRHPRWYPALVSFAYSDHDSYFSFTVGSGYHGRHHGGLVGWFPLGPRDHYHSWHRHHPVFVDRSRRVYNYENVYIDNSVHIDNSVTNIYQNQYVQNAITVMPRREFAELKDVRTAAMPATLNANAIPQAQNADFKIGAPALSEVPNIGVNAPRAPKMNLPRNPVPTTVASTLANRVEKTQLVNTAVQPRRAGSVQESGDTPIGTNVPQVAAPRSAQPKDARGTIGNTASVAEDAANGNSRIPRTPGSVSTASEADGSPRVSQPRSVENKESAAANTGSRTTAPRAAKPASGERSLSSERGASTDSSSAPTVSAPRSVGESSDSTSNSRSVRPSSNGRSTAVERGSGAAPSVSAPRSIDRDSTAPSTSRSARPLSNGRTVAPERGSDSTPGSSAPSVSAPRSIENRSDAGTSRSARPLSNGRSVVPERSTGSGSSDSPSVSAPRTIENRADASSTTRSARPSSSERSVSPGRDSDSTPSVSAPRSTNSVRESGSASRTTRPTSIDRSSSAARGSSDAPSVSSPRSLSAPRSVDRDSSSTPAASRSVRPSSEDRGSASSRSSASSPSVSAPRTLSAPRSDDVNRPSSSSSRSVSPSVERSTSSGRSSSPSVSAPRTRSESPARSTSGSVQRSSQPSRSVLPQISPQRSSSRPMSSNIEERVNSTRSTVLSRPQRSSERSSASSPRSSSPRSINLGESRSGSTSRSSDSLSNILGSPSNSRSSSPRMASPERSSSSRLMAPSRSPSGGSRESYSAPSRSISPSRSASYSAPSRSSSPSRSSNYSAPSRSVSPSRNSTYSAPSQNTSRSYSAPRPSEASGGRSISMPSRSSSPAVSSPRSGGSSRSASPRIPAAR